MITCTLGGKMHTVDFISGRALREIEPASKMYARLVRFAAAAEGGETAGPDEAVTIPDALDVMVHWFCLLFGNRFTPDDVYDNYPADRMLHDIALALVAVQTQTTSVLDEFPTKPVTEVAENLTRMNQTRR